MELRHLRYFAEVAHTLNFRQAAEQLHVSRPALSMQVRDLEEELGVRLLDRNTARVELTAAGAVFLEDVTEILARVERARQRVREAAIEQSPRVIIGEMGPLTPSFLPTALRRFRQRFPEIEVSIVDVDKEEQIRALREGRLDVGFLIDIDLNLPEGFCSRPLLSSPIGLGVARDHRLAGRKSVRLDELMGEQFVVNSHRRARAHLAHTRECFEKQGLPTPRISSAESFEGLVAMVASQQGISLMPEILTENRPREIAFVPIPRGLSVPRITLLAVWLANGVTPVVQSFVNAFDPLAEDDLQIVGG